VKWIVSPRAFTPLFYVLCRKLAGRFARVPRVRLVHVAGAETARL
jgi:hypothetical protein